MLFGGEPTMGIARVFGGKHGPVCASLRTGEELASDNLIILILPFFANRLGASFRIPPLW